MYIKQRQSCRRKPEQLDSAVTIVPHDSSKLPGKLFCLSVSITQADCGKCSS